MTRRDIVRAALALLRRLRRLIHGVQSVPFVCGCQYSDPLVYLCEAHAAILNRAKSGDLVRVTWSKS